MTYLMGSFRGLALPGRVCICLQPEIIQTASMSKESNETPSKFLHDIGPGFTPVITSHGDVNFFEKSFEKAMNIGQDGKLPPLKGVPALNSKLKLNSIQLISPPSDSNPATMSSSIPDFSNNSATYATSRSSVPVSMYDKVPGIHIPTAMQTSMTGSVQVNIPPTSIHHGHQALYETPQHAFPIRPIIPPQQMIHQNLSEASLGHMQHSGSAMQLEPATTIWATSLQQAKASSIEKQLRFQEKNRLAAMKSRQRKKREWERLQDSEKSLMEENRSLKERIAVLEGEIRVMRENNLSRRSEN